MGFYAPMAKRIIETGFLSGDWFLNLTPYHQNILWLIGKFSLLVGLPVSFFIFHFLTVFIYLGATYLFVWELSKNKNIALFAMSLLSIVIPFGLGGYCILANYFVPGNLAYALILFSGYFFLGGKYFLMFLGALLAAKVHFLAGLNWLILISPYYIYVLAKNKKYKEFIWIILVFLILLWPDILALLRLQENTLGFSQVFLNINVRFRYPHHYLLTAQSILNILFVAIFILFILRQIKIFFSEKQQQKIVYLIFGLIFFMLVNLFFVDLWPVVLIAKLQFLRLTFLFEYLFIVLFAFTIRPLYFLLLVFLPPLVYFFPDQRIQAFFMIMVMYYALYGLKNSKKQFHIRKDYIFALIVFWIFLFGIDFTKKVAIDLKKQATPWAEVCIAARNLSGADAVFLVPPDLEGFRLVAERAVVVDFKACPYLEKDTTEWLCRITDIAGPLPGNLNMPGFALLPILTDNYDKLSWSSICRFGSKYNADYVITRTYYSEKKVLYKNKKFYIYSL